MVRHLDYLISYKKFPDKPLRNPKRRLDDSDPRSELEKEQQIQNDLKRVERKYRSIQTYTRSYKDIYACQMQIPNHNLEVKLEDLKDVCLTGRRVASIAYAKKDEKMNATLLELIKERLVMNKKIADIKESIKEKKRQLFRSEKQFSKLISHQVKQVRKHDHEKWLKLLPKYENKLSLAVALKDKAVASAVTQRKVAASKVSERVISREQYENCLSNLAKGKRYLSDLYEKGLKAFHDREEAEQSVYTVKKKRQKDLSKAKLLLTDLNRMYWRYMNRAKLFTVKGQRRIISVEGENEASSGEDSEDENELGKYLATTQPYIMEIIAFFNGNDDMAYINRYIHESREENRNHMKLLIYFAAVAEQMYFMSKMYKSEVKKLNTKKKRELLNQKTRIEDLEMIKKRLEFNLDYVKRVLVYKEKFPMLVLRSFDKLIKSSPLKYLFQESRAWHAPHLIEEALSRIQEISVALLEIYSKNNQDIYPKVLYRDPKNPKRIKYVLPTDKRERKRAIQLVLYEKDLRRRLKKQPTPCSYCAEIQRFTDFKKKEDKVRNRPDIYEKVMNQGINDEELINSRCHSLLKCPSPKFKEIFTNTEE